MNFVRPRLGLGPFARQTATALLGAVAVLAAACADENLSDNEQYQEASSSCACDHGWDYWGNPIPIETTRCGYLACGLDDNEYTCTSSGWQTTGTSGCSSDAAPLSTKFGINSAIPVNTSSTAEAETAALGMGHYLEIAYAENDKYAVAHSVQGAIDAGAIPIVRICDANPATCQFKDFNAYVRFLRHIDDQVSGVFYAIAGANEPLTEKWIPGTESVVFNGGYTAQQLSTLGLHNAQYANNVIAALGARVRQNGGQIALLSPVLNCTNPQMPPFVGQLNAHGLDWSRLSGIAGNAYNIDTAGGQTITGFLSQCRTAFSSQGIAAPSDRFYLTEIGPYEITRGVARSTALSNLSQQVALLRGDRGVRAALFFNGFGSNPSSDFAYGVIATHEWQSIIGPPPADCPCSSSPGVDNFCLYAPGTPNCPMTNPGGYCDRNMSGTYDDADWLAGWYDYQATCGS